MVKKMKSAKKIVNYPLGLLAAFLACLAISAVHPIDYFTWFIEIVPAFIALGLLLAIWKRFRLSNFTLTLILIHSLILMLGGHYSYEKFPLGDWAKEAFNLGRNHFDRVGHLAQGFFPALVAREVLLRRTPLKAGAWMFFLVTCVCLAFSALYELFEMAMALHLGSSADKFLGSQGDIWDAQWDMTMALIGAIVGQIALSKAQDKALKG
jgi:putative membrane protein